MRRYEGKQAHVNEALFRENQRLLRTSMSQVRTHLSCPRLFVPPTHSCACLLASQKPDVPLGRADALRKELEAESNVQALQATLEEERARAATVQRELQIQIDQLRKERKDLECRVGGVDMQLVQVCRPPPACFRCHFYRPLLTTRVFFFVFAW